MESVKWGQLISQIIVWTVVIGVSISAVGPVLYWHSLPTRDLDVRIIDKTVPYPDYREHKNLIWGLKHRRISPPGTASNWDKSSDYIGFHPKKDGTPEGAIRQNLEWRDVRDIDALFIADSYGVYTGDYREGGKRNKHLDYSEMIYGGLNINEARVIKTFVENGGHLVGEFNTFATPTEGNARDILENLLGVEWTGWTGRYFRDLDDLEIIPRWAPQLYQEQYDRDWEFDGPGWIFIHADTRIFVLLEGKDITPKGITIDIDRDEPLVREANRNVPYRFWFDVVSPGDTENVIASYDLDLKPPGQDKISNFEAVSSRFPAIIRASRDPLRLYMAGDFTDQFKDLGPARYWGWARFQQFLTRFRSSDRPEYFSWGFYQPVLNKILNSMIELEEPDN